MSEQIPNQGQPSYPQQGQPPYPQQGQIFSNQPMNFQHQTSGHPPAGNPPYQNQPYYPHPNQPYQPQAGVMSERVVSKPSRKLSMWIFVLGIIASIGFSLGTIFGCYNYFKRAFNLRFPIAAAMNLIFAVLVCIFARKTNRPASICLSVTGFALILVIGGLSHGLSRREKPKLAGYLLPGLLFGILYAIKAAKLKNFQRI